MMVSKKCGSLKNIIRHLSEGPNVRSNKQVSLNNQSSLIVPKKAKIYDLQSAANFRPKS